MPEMIDRQAVMEIAMKYCPDDDGCCSKAGHDLRELLDEIEALPTIEPEVQHGRWIEGISRGSYSIYCSCCGSHKETICPSNYCPECGTQMDAEDINIITEDGGTDNAE